MNRPPILADLGRLLEEPLADALSPRYGKLEISLLSHTSMVADGTTVLLLRDSAGQRRAVAICSAPAAPDMVRRAMNRAREAKAILGASIGAPILDPLAERSVEGLSYAVLPYCKKLSEFRAVWWPQRALLRPLILDWLARVTECTTRGVEPAITHRDFAERLQRMASLKPLSEGLRAAAKWSAARLDDGAWTPRHVLMHGDLWKGNILIRPANGVAEQWRWRERFVIIDWGGWEIHGYPIYDLVRLAQSIRLPARGLRSEVYRHCQLLGCEPADAKSNLLAALGHIHLNLEHLPFGRFAHIADNTLTTLERALAS